MTDREALLRAVIENPDDDAPRLVYADWLDEHRQADRAEFIRLQIEVHNGAKVIDEAWYERAEAIAARVQELEAEYGQTWLGEFEGTPPVAEWYFERGFVRDIGVEEPEAFMVHASILFDNHPIEALAPGLVPIPEVIRMPWLSRLRELNLNYGVFSPADLAVLAESTSLRRLERLDLSSSPLTDDGVDALLSGPLVGQLRSLNLDGTSITRRGAEALARSPLLDRLEELDVRGCTIGYAGQRALRQRFGPRLSE